jgi:hypothetical protein
VETQVRTPQQAFAQPQRLIVPLFQRPYVWNQENQWEPLWNDVARVAQRQLAAPSTRHQPHFFGAVVLQQLQNPMGTMQERTIIDGQQRLTTLQILLDVLRVELAATGSAQPAKRLQTLVLNPEPFCENEEDRFKIWPTNRDQAAFSEIMSAKAPINYDGLEHGGSRLTQAHQYFAERTREWLTAEGPGETAVRAAAIERVVSEQLQMVVIDLTADENAQEIFETLNARGAHLTAADLIKNFVFQRLTEEGEDVQGAYDDYWKHFETGFWETEISAGRVRQPRASIFLNHWLIARTGEEIVAREVFSRFKTFTTYDTAVPMRAVLAQLKRAAAVYRTITTDSTVEGVLDQLGLFAYRTSVMESEVVKPLLLCLLDPEDELIPPAQLSKALGVIESWLVRRMLVNATSKSYTQVMATLINQVRKEGIQRAGDALEERLRTSNAANMYWPDDEELVQELTTAQAYRRFSRGRLRMILEAVEDYLRGWQGNAAGLGGQRVARNTYVIEHIMPQSWRDNWPLDGGVSAQERDEMIHSLGNLTLLTGRLNSKVSNGPWDGEKGKRAALQAHDVLMLNRQLPKVTEGPWNDTLIRERTQALIESIREIWPVPEGHRVDHVRERQGPKRRITIADLIGAGLISAGTVLYARRPHLSTKTATVLSDGTLDVDGVTYTTPSGAARALTGKQVNGWEFWLIDPKRRLALTELWRQYVEQTAVEVDETDAPDQAQEED